MVAALIFDFLAASPILVLLSTPALALLTYCFYNLFLHPLSSVPGPWYTHVLPLWLWYHEYVGNESSSVDQLHHVYGPVLRVAPNDIDIKDGAALAPIYSEKGGFLKAPCYANFDIEGHRTIFSALDPAHRAERSKAIVGMFATSTIRKEGGEEAIEQSVQKLVARMERAKASGEVLNNLDLARRLAVDAVTGYLFGQTYGGLDEDAPSAGVQKVTLSASAFVDTFVAVGRFFLLPNSLFHLMDLFIARFMPADSTVDDSMSRVHAYTDKLAESAQAEDNTYQGRLLKAGISKHEISCQCMDLMFAGTDSSGMNVSAICWHLVRRPESLKKLTEEVRSNTDARYETLPYLQAVVKEGLRISMANPTRLPRQVPPSGWSFGGHYFPPGTSVGCALYSLHFNEAVFPDAHAFRPERWLDGNATPEMQRDAIPFGLGARQCIARNLASVELHIATRRIAESGVLEGGQNVGRCANGIEIDEWFNSKVVGHAVELSWA